MVSKPMFQLMMRTEMVFEMLVYSPFIHTHTHIYIYTHTHIYTYVEVVCFFPIFPKKLSQLHACMHAQVYIQSIYLKEYMTASYLGESQTQTPQICCRNCNVGVWLSFVYNSF